MLTRLIDFRDNNRHPFSNYMQPKYNPRKLVGLLDWRKNLPGVIRNPYQTKHTDKFLYKPPGMPLYHIQMYNNP